MNSRPERRVCREQIAAKVIAPRALQGSHGHFLGVFGARSPGWRCLDYAAGARMNERTLLALGLLLGIGSGKPPEQWLQSAHEYGREKQAEDPMNSAALTVLAGAAAFYAAE